MRMGKMPCIWFGRLIKRSLRTRRAMNPNGATSMPGWSGRGLGLYREPAPGTGKKPISGIRLYRKASAEELTGKTNRF
jgi:hypothetical protein